jgi:hypothetical protein
MSDLSDFENEVPNLTPVCERCGLIYSHHFDVFYMERQP